MFWREFLKSLSIMSPILIFGVLGFMYFEELGVLDALYLTIITITTVGYGDIAPHHPAGKIFTIILVSTGVGFVAYMFGRITEAMIEGGLRDILGESKMNRTIAGLKDHYIVCGFGRIGKEICKILHDNHRPFVVIENDPEQVSHVEKLGYVEMHGEAADDEILIAAGIKRAQGLIAVVSTDADNVYITLTARGLNPNLQIIARSSEARGSETKLLRAGANKVISPYSIGARRMAQLIVRPTVMDFLDLTMHTGDLGLRLEELRVSEKAGIANKSLMDSKLRSKYDMIVVAIKRKDGEMLFNPKPATMILPGDVLVVLGELDQIKAMEMAV